MRDIDQVISKQLLDLFKLIIHIQLGQERSWLDWVQIAGD